MAAAIICLYAPKFTAAEIIDRRIRRLVRANKGPEAVELAEEARLVGIPLRVDLATSLVPAAMGGNFATLRGVNATVTAPKLLSVTLADDYHIKIVIPFLWIKDGHRETSELRAHEASIAGSGASSTRIIFDPSIRAATMLNYGTDMEFDALIYGFSITGAGSLLDNGAKFLAINPCSHRVAVSRVDVLFLTQILDFAIWENVVFSDCKIICGGGPLHLTNVLFTRCSFVLAEGLPASVRQRFAGSRDDAVSLRHGD